MFARNDNRNGCRCGRGCNDENTGFFNIDQDGQEFDSGYDQGFGSVFGGNEEESFEQSGQGFSAPQGQGSAPQGQGFAPQGQGFAPQGQGCPPGQTRRYVTNTNVNGRTCNINNRYYYDNYFNRYNRYFVNDVNYVKRYVRDINVWHHTTKTVDCGTQYLGPVNVNSGCPCGGRSGCGNNGGNNGGNNWGNNGGNGCGCEWENDCAW